jgi:hypothetical protein
MSTKKYLEEFASVSIFESLTNPMSVDVIPVTLYLPKRKFIKSEGRYYNAIIDHFNGRVEEVYPYFFNLGHMPKLRSFDLDAAPGGTSYIYTWKEPQRDYIMRNSVFYYGHVTYNFNKACSMFLEGNWQGLYRLFKSYFKKEFKPEELQNYFPDAPKCHLFDEAYYSAEGDEASFKRNTKDRIELLLSYGTSRRPHKDIKFARCIGLTHYEYSRIHEKMLLLKVKINKYLLMVTYAMDQLGILPEDSNFYQGFKSEEIEQYRSPQEEVTCSSSQEDHQSDPQSAL